MAHSGPIFRNLGVQQMEFGILSDSILVDLEKKHLRTEQPGEAFPLETTKHGAVGGKNARPTPFSMKTLGSANLAAFTRAMEQAQDLQKSP